MRLHCLAAATQPDFCLQRWRRSQHLGSLLTFEQWPLPAAGSSAAWCSVCFCFDLHCIWCGVLPMPSQLSCDVIPMPSQRMHLLVVPRHVVGPHCLWPTRQPLLSAISLHYAPRVSLLLMLVTAWLLMPVWQHNVCLIFLLRTSDRSWAAKESHCYTARLDYTQLWFLEEADTYTYIFAAWHCIGQYGCSVWGWYQCSSLRRLVVRCCSCCCCMLSLLKHP
jgi:hypothetical protein